MIVEGRLGRDVRKLIGLEVLKMMIELAVGESAYYTKFLVGVKKKKLTDQWQEA